MLAPWKHEKSTTAAAEGGPHTVPRACCSLDAVGVQAFQASRDMLKFTLYGLVEDSHLKRLRHLVLLSVIYVDKAFECLSLDKML